MEKLRLFVGFALLLISQISTSQTTTYEQEILKYRGPQCAEGFEDELFLESQGCARLRKIPQFRIPDSPGVRPSGNNRAFVLLEPMNYEVGSTGAFIKVPTGFVTDYASVPKPLWGLYSPHDQYSRAAVVHDFLYWTQRCTRLQADNLFMIAMKESDVKAATREAVYAGVRLAGEDPWKRNAYERSKNMPRVVPAGRRDFPPNWTWEMYRARLIIEEIKDPPFNGSVYCALGNSTDVPFHATGSKQQPAMVQRPIR